ncbi:hypothetical protein SARC_09425 [Sphaeroforma arctica JP610]|uniref:GS catalytic domain-containing protein n=1 Tax=Sphaeroforma arctica JP610 TaxID=667725 RepID=A0A0L0FQ70_9EUKA|nr:hypothetical protein SARC_09425 [Sphaeroforma arctica JP610]KNC78128.1 hypothetical protein SARC_09425 [Sphaeroforma arctica JP610]|eukprot:XP_014152030.1 hypothetical protein SARC_09425 [Sphaeroforma arctica JP610]
MIKGGGVSWCVAMQSCPVMADGVSADTGLTAVGEVFQVPDWTTLTKLPYHPAHARVMGDLYTRQGQPWELCQRGFLKRMIADAAALGFEIKAAFEPEFYILRRNSTTGELMSVDDDVYAAVMAMDKMAPVLDEIADALSEQGLIVEMCHPEAGPGQHELTVKYTDALGAADQHIIYRETVKAVAYKHGLVATFVPKLHSDKCGSGNHLHISVWKGGVNVMSDNSHLVDSRTGSNDSGLSETGQHFAAGVLHSLAGLMPLICPSTNSYRRLLPMHWSGAYRVWGIDNKEAAVRVPTNPHPKPYPTNIEVKPCDNSANPYLALGGVIVAGLDGIRQRRPLPQRMDVDPATLSELEREVADIQRLPETLVAAVKALQKNEVLKQALGEPLLKAIVGVRLAEWNAMHDMTLKEETKLLLNRY